MQSEAPVQLIQVPPKPTCSPVALFSGADCQDRWNIYNQAVAQRQQQDLQLYVSHQKEIASAQASAPLQQQIASLSKLVSDQQAQVKNLHEQMQAQTVAASQSALAAHKDGLQQGVGIGLGSALLVFALVYTIRRMTKTFTITKKASAASA